MFGPFAIPVVSATPLGFETEIDVAVEAPITKVPLFTPCEKVDVLTEIFVVDVDANPFDPPCGNVPLNC